MELSISQGQEQCLLNIKQVIQTARRQVSYAVNRSMVEAYWKIGRLIVEQEQEGEERAQYGTQLIKNLAKQLVNEFGKGFQARNLRSMRAFYLAFPKWNAVRTELSWTHYRQLVGIKEEQKRAFYLDEAVTNFWSTRELSRQINAFYYERHLKAGIRWNKSTGEEVAPHDAIIKDPYVLEFLDLKEEHYFVERKLEAALIAKLQDFLMELGKGFAFVARQKRITTESGKHFYIDLVFYHFILNCFILIDLKIGALTHADIGQMDMYVRLYEDKWRQGLDSPTLGIILCSEKDQTIVKYSILNDSHQIFASRYQFYLPTEEELSNRIQEDLKELRLNKELK